MRIFFKLPGLLFLVALYIIFGCIIALLPARATLRRALLIKNTSFGSRLMLRILGVHLCVKHGERLHDSTCARLVVANHLSYIDILIIASIAPSVFITSVELGNTLVLGMLARLAGSIFVERRNASNLRQEISIIHGLLRDSFRIVLFPEGTTSNGDQIQPFKKSFFHAAILAKAEILPVCIRYTGVNGEPMNKYNRDSIFYYGDISFFRHFHRLLSLASVDVEITSLNIIDVQEKDNRKNLAVRAYDQISAVYRDVCYRDGN
jgi:1-acyl-sn-glycerol-3-phosphate acyltransferase